jgi:hypothetical protein
MKTLDDCSPEEWREAVKAVERTPWFPVSMKPVRPGWYEAKYAQNGAIARRHFDGEHWATEFGTLYAFSMDRDDEWRGLARNPKP